MTMYDRYDGLIFDMDGTLLDSEPTHQRAWDAVLGRYGMDYDLTAVIALNGSPTWRIAQAIIEHNQSDLNPHALAAEKTRAVEYAVGLRTSAAAGGGCLGLYGTSSHGRRYRQ